VPSHLPAESRRQATKDFPQGLTASKPVGKSLDFRHPSSRHRAKNNSISKAKVGSAYHGRKSRKLPALAAKLRAFSVSFFKQPDEPSASRKPLRQQGKAPPCIIPQSVLRTASPQGRTARFSLLAKTSFAMGCAHYSTARKSAPASPVQFS